jgi:tRNA pseudouridine55 synthase
MARRRPPTVHGLVLLDKPAGMTSHDVVFKLRSHFGEKRIGHAGTLDPDATGLLVIGVGNGTRLIRFMGDMDKTYSCEIVFGTETDTLDDSGVTTATHEMAPPDIADIRRVIAEKFVGDILQIPPMVSALRVDGVRLHQLAREGIEVERQPRPITVYSYDVEPTDDPMVIRATVRCGGGTYIRSLGADLGTALGGGAHIRTLRRHTTGPYSLDDACTLEEPVLLPLIETVRGMPTHVLDEKGIDDVLYGRVREAWDGDGPWATTNTEGELIAVFELWRDRIAKPTVVFGGRG